MRYFGPASRSLTGIGPRQNRTNEASPRRLGSLTIVRFNVPPRHACGKPRRLAPHWVGCAGDCERRGPWAGPALAGPGAAGGGPHFAAGPLRRGAPVGAGGGGDAGFA